MSATIRHSALVGVLLTSAVLLPRWLGGDEEVDGFAIPSPRPAFPAEHVYNRQDLAGYVASDAAASMLARGYTDVRYASDSTRVPSDKGCTPGEVVGVYGVGPDGTVWLQTFRDPAGPDPSAPTAYDVSVSARLARCAR
ncbi:hypothetical protein ACGFMK_16350 [Amycolatopsis sp. NPDC049252]|uniref:hypothetical protein n=1 Tax=Amycolatopsis sp. NPDC049252 TaxID=3363933 RepID=UPI00371BE26B